MWYQRRSGNLLWQSGGRQYSGPHPQVASQCCLYRTYLHTIYLPTSNTLLLHTVFAPLFHYIPWWGREFVCKDVYERMCMCEYLCVCGGWVCESACTWVCWCKWVTWIGENVLERRLNFTSSNTPFPSSHTLLLIHLHTSQSHSSSSLSYTTYPSSSSHTRSRTEVLGCWNHRTCHLHPCLLPTS